jgi:6-phosphogluconolactonase
MARETLLDAVPLLPGNIHRIHGEKEPRLAAAVYELELRSFFGSGASEESPPASFDLVLLGMGDDGHTASLFPGLAAVTEQMRWVMAQYVKVVSMWRITLTPVAINAARNVTFVVSGADKAQRLHDVLEGPIQPEVLPAQIVRPARGRLLWLIDKAAAGCLKKAD